MTAPDHAALCERLRAIAALESGWYANVGRKTGEQCCQAAREAAAAIERLAAALEKITETTGPAASGGTIQALAGLSAVEEIARIALKGAADDR